MLEGVANFLPFCGVFWKVKILLEIIEGNTLRADLLFFFGNSRRSNYNYFKKLLSYKWIAFVLNIYNASDIYAENIYIILKLSKSSYVISFSIVIIIISQLIHLFIVFYYKNLRKTNNNNNEINIILMTIKSLKKEYILGGHLT